MPLPMASFNWWAAHFYWRQIDRQGNIENPFWSGILTIFSLSVRPCVCLSVPKCDTSAADRSTAWLIQFWSKNIASRAKTQTLLIFALVDLCFTALFRVTVKHIEVQWHLAQHCICIAIVRRQHCKHGRFANDKCRELTVQLFGRERSRHTATTTITHSGQSHLNIKANTDCKSFLANNLNMKVFIMSVWQFWVKAFLFRSDHWCNSDIVF